MDSLKTPQEIATLLNDAIAEHKSGHLQPALEKYKRILKSVPKHLDALQLTGLAYFQAGQNDKSVKYIERAIKVAPNQSSFHNNLGLAYAAQDKHEKAIKCYKKAIDINANYPDAMHNLANSFKKIKKPKSAIKYYKNAIKLKPDYYQAYNELATALQSTGKTEEAIKQIQKALTINSNDYSIYNNLGIIQRAHNQPDKAINSLKIALSLIKNQNESSNIPSKELIILNMYNAIGVAYIDLGQFDNAIDSFNDALSINSSNIEAIFCKSTAFLSNGEFKLGWEAYEFRSKKPKNTHLYNNILANHIEWQGPQFDKDTPLVILPEQGIGDEIMFASIIPDLVNDHNGEITLVCDERLVEIFKRSLNNISVSGIKRLETSPSHQRIYIGSLAKYYRNSATDFKPQQAFIYPNNKTKQHFCEKYAGTEGLRIGIAWKSGNTVEGFIRSRPLIQWKDILSAPNCSFFNLQYGDVQQEIDEFTSQTGIKIINDTEVDQLKSIEDFIAQISTLDLIITIDNSTAHIAGALGIPTWIMLPYNCDWRWMRNRDDSLWYKSLRLYRQKEIGNWDNVMEGVINDLANNNIQPKAEPQPPVAVKPTQNQSPKKKVQNSAVTKNQKNIKSDRKIAFLNDTTAWYHWGCTATSEAIRKRIIQSGYKSLNVPINFSYNFQCIPQTSEDFDNPEFFNNASKTHNDLFQAINSCDQVVINGEGSIHHLSKVSLSLLYMAYASKKFLNKPVHIINHSPYPENVREPQDNFAFQLYKAVYNQLDYIAIREHISHKLMTSYGVDASLSFDCLPITVTEDYKPEKLDTGKNIVVSGSVSFSKDKIADLGKLMQYFHQQGYKIKVLHGAKAFPAQDDLIFIQELQKLSFKNYEVIDAKSLTEWLDCINSANVFISGRFHHSLAAIYLETPCVMMESNTLKNVALAETFNLPEPIRFDSDNFFDELLERTEKALKSEPVDIELRKSLLQRSEVNFERIPEFG